MHFTVSERKIKCDDANIKLIGDNADYTASFTFDEEWEGQIKTARFQLKNKYADVILEDDACTIPASILKQGILQIGVYTEKITSMTCEIQVMASIKEKAGNVAAPAYDVYTQILNKLQALEDSGVSDEQLQEAVNSAIAENETLKNSIETAVNEYLSDRDLQDKGLIFDNLDAARSVSAIVDETLINQDYLGGYIEIQPDSWDGCICETDDSSKTWGFPYSLNHPEQIRLRNMVLHGNGTNLMYIRFPLGFAYRGYRNIDDESGYSKNIGERFKGQNATLKELLKEISCAGGGLAPEYWCPPPYWVTSGTYNGDNYLWAGGTYGRDKKLSEIRTTDETQYKLQIENFTEAIINDLEYVHTNIAPVRMFSLQNEPKYHKQIYGACAYDAQTYNDVLEVLYPKILSSKILTEYNDEPNEVKLLVASSDESSPFDGIAKIFIANHSNMIWGYTHHSMKKVSGESYSDGADWYKTSEFTTIKGNKKNIFINEYEYFKTNFGTDDFRCSNNMLHLINEAVYGEAKVLHPIIHICKPLGQTLASTNTKGYAMFEANLKGQYGVEPNSESNDNALAKGTFTTNPTMYNSWSLFGDNLPIGAYLVGSYKNVIQHAGWCTYKFNGKLYIFMANTESTDVNIILTFANSKLFKGKIYSMKYCGEELQQKIGKTITFTVPAYSGLCWIEQNYMDQDNTDTDQDDTETDQDNTDTDQDDTETDQDNTDTDSDNTETDNEISISTKVSLDEFMATCKDTSYYQKGACWDTEGQIITNLVRLAYIPVINLEVGTYQIEKITNKSTRRIGIRIFDSDNNFINSVVENKNSAKFSSTFTVADGQYLRFFLWDGFDAKDTTIVIDINEYTTINLTKIE